MCVRIIKFFHLLLYSLCENHYSRKDGYYVQFSSKYHEISKQFSIYYLEGGKYVCSFEGVIEDGHFKLDLDNPRVFGQKVKFISNYKDLDRIKNRVKFYLKRYHSKIDINTTEN